jgi:hypothetical protein
MRYQEVFKADPALYHRLRQVFEDAGLVIPDGADVEPTEWAYENGVVRRDKNARFIKIRNGRDGWNILVRKNRNSQPDSYWAGFWKSKAPAATEQPSKE